MGEAEDGGWSGESTVHHAKEADVPSTDEEHKLVSEVSPRKMNFFEESSSKNSMPHLQYTKAHIDSLDRMHLCIRILPLQYLDLQMRP